MKTDPYTPPDSPAIAQSISDNPNRYSVAVAILKWAQWTGVAFLILLIHTFAVAVDPDRPHWVLDVTGVSILAILLPLTLFVGLFLLRKVTNPWLNVVLYGVGLFLTFFLISCGFFAVLSGDFTLIAVGIMVLLIYCPLINNKLTQQS